MVLVRNKYFWDNANVDIDKVIFKGFESSDAEARDFEAGGLDFAGYVSPSNALEVKEETPERVSIYPSLNVWFIVLNATKEKFSDPRVRQALSLAIDRDTLVKTVNRGTHAPAYSLVPPHVLDYRQAHLKGVEGMTYAQRLAKAKKLMEEAGYSEEKPLKFDAFVMNNPIRKRNLVAVAAFWKNIHVQTTIVQQDSAEYAQALEGAQHEASYAGWGGDYNDPTTFLTLFKSTSGPMNFPHDNYKEFDRLLDRTYQLPSGKQRWVAMRKAEQALLDRGYLIPLSHRSGLMLFDPKVITNFAPNIAQDYRVRFLKMSRK